MLKNSMAVYTKVSESEASAFLDAYNIGNLVALTGIKAGVENTNYRLNTDRGAFILTLYEKRMKPEELPFFLNLMAYLAARGILCPQPIVNRHGKMVGDLAGKKAAMVTHLSGESRTLILPEHCAALGRNLAEMHLAVGDFKESRSNSMGLDSWRSLAQSIGKAADDFVPELSSRIRRELQSLYENWPQDLPEGIIHADLFPDNVLFDGDNLSGFIDFYFACRDFFAYDLAICLNAWCFEQHRGFNLTKASAMMRAYDAVRPLSVAEKKALPVLARGSALRFMLSRMYDSLNTSSEALVKMKDPKEYLYRLDFHAQAPDASAYGVS